MQFSKENNWQNHYSLTKCVLEDGSENFIKLTEIYPWQSLLVRKLQYLESPLYERSAPLNIFF